MRDARHATEMTWNNMITPGTNQVADSSSSAALRDSSSNGNIREL